MSLKVARRTDLPRDGLPGSQPLGQFRPPTPARDVAHRDGDGLFLADQYNQPLPTCDAGVEKVPLQHGVVLRHDRDDYGGVFRALGFMNRGGIGGHQGIEFAEAIGD